VCFNPTPKSKSPVWEFELSSHKRQVAKCRIRTERQYLTSIRTYEYQNTVVSLYVLICLRTIFSHIITSLHHQMPIQLMCKVCHSVRARDSHPITLRSRKTQKIGLGSSFGFRIFTVLGHPKCLTCVVTCGSLPNMWQVWSSSVQWAPMQLMKKIYKLKADSSYAWRPENTIPSIYNAGDENNQENAAWSHRTQAQHQCRPTCRWSTVVRQPAAVD